MKKEEELGFIGPQRKKPRLIGYARVSTFEQSLDLQVDALKKAGVKKGDLYTDKISGAKDERTKLDKCLGMLEKGDIFVIWKLDRLGRKPLHLMDTVCELQKKGIGFKSICDAAFDTSSASGRFLFSVQVSLAQLERDLIRERTMAGLEAARSRGRFGGRKPISSDDPRVKTAKRMHDDKSIKIEEICKTLKISLPTLYRYLKLAKS